ncbi:hypothetical protein CR513_08815, partial [Mucuna pruriens]
MRSNTGHAGPTLQTTPSPTFLGQPFGVGIDQVIITPAPHFRELLVDPFDGTQDPHKHLQDFQTQVYISGRDNDISCKLFLGTLRGITMQWFSGLSPRTIHTFNDLVMTFWPPGSLCTRLELVDTITWELFKLRCATREAQEPKAMTGGTKTGVKTGVKIEVDREIKVGKGVKVGGQPLHRGTIATISGGGLTSKMIESGRRRHIQSIMTVQVEEAHPRDPIISFLITNYDGVLPHQDDLMVISVVATEYKVERVLVD